MCGAVELSRGCRLGQYELLAPIGAGGMGEAWKARDTRLGRDVALKFLPELFAGDPDRLARFQREAQVLASLNHPNSSVTSSRGCSISATRASRSRTCSADGLTVPRPWCRRGAGFSPARQPRESRSSPPSSRVG
jgi:serine/threonine protein kinase